MSDSNPRSRYPIKEHILARMNNELVKTAKQYAHCDSLRQIFTGIILEHMEMELEWRREHGER